MVFLCNKILGLFNFAEPFIEVVKTNFERVDFRADFLLDIGKESFVQSSFRLPQFKLMI